MKTNANAREAAPEILGPKLFERDEEGHVLSKVGTVFLKTPGLVTQKKLHIFQRDDWLEHVKRRRAQAGLRAYTESEELEEMTHSVPLLMDDHFVYIRPDGGPKLAKGADEFLQAHFGVPKHLIRYLNVSDPGIRANLRERGELWRMMPEPINADEMAQFIENARLAMDGRAIYFYNRNTGVRYVTPSAFRSLDELPDAELRAHLVEIQTLNKGRNRLGKPEAAFFPADCAFNAAFKDADLSAPDIRAVHAALRGEFFNACDPAFHKDDPRDEAWRNAMCKTLSAGVHDTHAEEIFKELSGEFFRKIRWLPGASFQNHVVRFDPIYSDPAPRVPDLQDFRARAIIHNFASDHRDIAHLNIGRVKTPLNLKRPRQDHDNTVYIVELRLKGARDLHALRHLRFNKWGVAERLKEAREKNKELTFERAVFESDEYTEFILDRRLACLQFGMSLPADLNVYRIRSTYKGEIPHYHGRDYWDTYTVRGFVPGIASDKIPAHLYANPVFATRLARLLGNAAALNIVIGRASVQDDKKPQIPFFDDGDEIIQLDDDLPKSLTISDPSGAFAHYAPTLYDIAPLYAEPVTSRYKFPIDHAAFAKTYLDHFESRLAEILDHYLENKTAFDTLFNYLPLDPKGNIRYRWETVLQRLRALDISLLIDRVKGGITPPSNNG